MRLTLPGLDCSAWPDLDADDVASMVASVGIWYHTIALPGVETPGYYDMRPYVPHYRLPELRGLEVLDVGSANGFFAFEFERRGATVTAADLPSYVDHDFPRHVLERERGKRTAAELSATDWNELHGGFLVARHALGSRVERVLTRVYGLPDVLPPRFDLVFCSNVLVHLRDPVLALEAMAAVCKPGGRAIVATPVLHQDWPDATPANLIGFGEGPAWWVPAPRTLCRWLELAGFRDVQLVERFDTRRVRGDRQGGHLGVVHAVR